MPSWFGSGTVIVQTSRSPVHAVPSQVPSTCPQTMLPGVREAGDWTPPAQGSFCRFPQPSASAIDSDGQLIAQAPQ